MEGIRLIGFSICITIVITAIFSMLTPNSKLDKVLKFAVSLFFLTSVISPFANNKFNFYIDLSDSAYKVNADELSKNAQNQFLSVAQKNIENSLIKLLAQQNISVKKIDILININDDDSISINRVMVYINRSDEKNKNAIKRIVNDKVGYVPEIVSE